MIEKEYRIGQYTLRQVAANHAVDPAAISRMAKRRAWVQDRRLEVKARSDAQLLKASQEPRKSSDPEKSTPTELEIDAAATTRTRVVLAHRQYALRARTLVMNMLSELETVTTAPVLLQDLHDCLTKCSTGQVIPPALRNRADLALQQALTLGNRAGILKSLVESLTKVVTIERQAFSINDPELPTPPAGRAASTFTDFAVFKAKFMAAAAAHPGAQR